MEMRGEQRIPAPRERVWAALNDAEILKQCIPGCETLEKLSDTHMRATARIKVGPVTARFLGEVTLSELDPPNGYRIDGEGQGGLAGFSRGGATVRLEQDGEETILHYAVDAQVGGKLAQLGGRLIDATAQQMAGAFFKKFAAALGDNGAQEDSATTDVRGKVLPPPPLAGPAGYDMPPHVPPSRGASSWFAPTIAIVAIAVLAWRLFGDGLGQMPVANVPGDGGMLILILVTLSGAVGFLFGERAR